MQKVVYLGKVSLAVFNFSPPILYVHTLKSKTTPTKKFGVASTNCREWFVIGGARSWRHIGTHSTHSTLCSVTGDRHRDVPCTSLHTHYSIWNNIMANVRSKWSGSGQWKLLHSGNSLLPRFSTVHGKDRFSPDYKNILLIVNNQDCRLIFKSLFGFEGFMQVWRGVFPLCVRL